MAISRYSIAQPTGQAITRNLRQPLYDTESYETAGNDITWFQKPQGQSTTFAGGTVTKTEWHTNMHLAGQIAPPNQFSLAGFRVEEMVGTLETCHITIYKWGLFKFYFGSNAWLTIPVSQIPQGVAMDGYGGQINRPRQGASAPVMYDFRIGKGADAYQKISPSESFYATLTFPAGKVTAYEATYVRCYLLGIYHSQL